MRIILASKSPRRREILDNIDVNFEVIESNFNEDIGNLKDPCEIVKYLAYEKAKSAAGAAGKDALIIGADTIVVCDDVIMGKPVDEQDSWSMLKKLSNRWHNVYSGICVINTSSGEWYTDFENTAVKIKELSDEEINSYINTKEPADKAGSYAIQGIGSLIVEKIDGCYFNVVGLPVYKLSIIFKKFGIDLLKQRG